MTAKTITSELEAYLLEHGFSGDIPQNSGHKNWLVIKKLVKNEPFYTFGIKRVEQAVKNHEITAAQTRDIMTKASGITISRFSRRGAGHFDTALVARKLTEAMEEINKRARAEQTMVFATGHPGALVGFMNQLAIWAESLGAKIVTTDRSIQVNGRFKLDQLGQVFVASDNCSAIHTHEPDYMDILLKDHQPDFAVADHGFAAAALNRNIPTIGFYDTDDPAIPLAAHFDLPVLGVPINDNCYNSDGATLANYIIERFGADAVRQPRRARTRTH